MTPPADCVKNWNSKAIVGIMAAMLFANVILLAVLGSRVPKAEEVTKPDIKERHLPNCAIVNLTSYVSQFLVAKSSS
jgi:hypothetical protein